MSSVVSVRISPDLNEKLEKLANATKRSKSFLAAEAIEDFVRYESWKVEVVEQSIREHEAGLGIPHEEAMRQVRDRIEEIAAQRKAG